MRILPFALVILFSVTPLARAQGVKSERAQAYLELMADADKKKALSAGTNHLAKWFKFDLDLNNPRVRRPGQVREKREKAKAAFMLWLQESQEAIGVDLMQNPAIVFELLDDARLKAGLAKVKPGRIDYVRVPAPRGMNRLEYSVLVPREYKPKDGRMPLVLSLHERVIDAKHPVFRGNQKLFLERSRQVLFDNWARSSAAEYAVVIAPTGLSDGFLFRDDTHYDDLHILLRTLGEAMTNYRVDWDRVFLEVHGRAFRIMCEQPFLFAGLIVRDRVDNRQRPFLKPEHHFVLENLNGTPLCYIADEAHWEKVGKPTADALTAAYKKAGADDKLLILKCKRDGNGALQPDPDVIQKFITTHKRPAVRKKLNWRFFRATMSSAQPLELGPLNYDYDLSPQARAAPLAEKCGATNFEVTLAEHVEGETKIPYNRVVINTTEAEGCQLLLFEGLIDWNLPTTIIVNGKELKTRIKLARQWDFFWRFTIPRRLLMLQLFGIVELDFEHVPQFVVPEEKGAEEKGAEEKPADTPGDKPAEKTDGASEASVEKTDSGK